MFDFLFPLGNIAAFLNVLLFRKGSLIYRSNLYIIIIIIILSDEAVLLHFRGTIFSRFAVFSTFHKNKNIIRAKCIKQNLQPSFAFNHSSYFLPHRWGLNEEGFIGAVLISTLMWTDMVLFWLAWCGDEFPGSPEFKCECKCLQRGRSALHWPG